MKELPLHGVRGQGLFALVSDPDFDRVSRRKWCLVNGYAAVKIEGKPLYMHRFLLNAPTGLDVDHVNHNPLDNRRENLRLATRSQNIANCRARQGTSRFKGVYLDKARNCWRSRVKFNGKAYTVGSYKDELDAARAYDSAALTLFGEFVHTNFPDSVAKPLRLIAIEALSRSTPRPKTGFFGVSKKTSTDAYVARVTINGIRHTVATRKTAIEAARDVDLAIRAGLEAGEQVSSFSRLNFL